MEKEEFLSLFFFKQKRNPIKKKWTEDLDIKFPIEGMWMATGT